MMSDNPSMREAYSDKVAQCQHLDDVRVKRDGELDDIPQPQKIEEAVENHTLHITRKVVTPTAKELFFWSLAVFIFVLLLMALVTGVRF